MMKTYMVIERFYPEKIRALYQRFETEGRLLPAGVVYLNSWIDEKVASCFQLMQSESLEKLEEWIGHWKEYAEFEVIPVCTSAEAKAKVMAEGWAKQS